MKKFKCTALDEDGKHYAGEFEALDLADARKKVLDQGFKIISLEEIDHKHASFKKAKPQPSGSSDPGLQATGKDSGRDYKNREDSEENQKLKKMFFLGLALVVGIPTAMLLLFLFVFKQPDQTPQETVQQYYRLQEEQDFASQFKLLAKRLREQEGGDARVYALSKSSQKDKLLPMKSLRLLDQQRSRAETEIILHDKTREKAVNMILLDEWGHWRIAAIRDMTDVEQQFKSLAQSGSLAEEQKAKIVLKETYGYSEQEIREKLQLFQNANQDEVQVLRKKAIELLGKLLESGKLSKKDYDQRLAEILQK